MIIERDDTSMPIILGAPFLATTRAQIDYESSTIRIKKGKKTISFPTIPRYLREAVLRKKMETDPSILRGNVQEKILAWEARIENYKEGEIREGEDEKENVVRPDEQASNPIEFKEGDLVLLRHLVTKAPADEPSPWWYGPFTIESLHQDGVVSLISKRGGEVTAKIERLRRYHPTNKDYIYQGYVIMRDEVT